METSTTTATGADVLPAAQLDAPGMIAAIAEHAALLRRIAAARVGPDLAEDVVSEAFERAWSRREAFDASCGDVRAWLVGIVVNASRAHGRAERRWQRRQRTGAALAIADARMPDIAAQAESRADGELAAPRLLRALSALSEVERTVLLLTVHAELAPAQIAEALELPAATVRSHLHRSRGRVVAFLNEEHRS